MARNAMQGLLRLRQLTADEARRDLACCLAEEDAAQQATDKIEATIAEETAAACLLEGDDQTVETFAAWLHRMRPQADAANEALQLAVLHTTEARAVLAAARAAAEAVESVIAHQHEHCAIEAARVEQHGLEETARAGRPAAASGGPVMRHAPAPDDPARNDPARNDPAWNDPARDGSAPDDPVRNDSARNGPARIDRRATRPNGSRRAG